MNTPRTKEQRAFYLDNDVAQLLTNVYIDRLQQNNKTTYSALVEEAIQLLHDKHKDADE